MQGTLSKRTRQNKSRNLCSPMHFNSLSHIKPTTSKKTKNNEAHAGNSYVTTHLKNTQKFKFAQNPPTHQVWATCNLREEAWTNKQTHPYTNKQTDIVYYDIGNIGGVSFGVISITKDTTMRKQTKTKTKNRAKRTIYSFATKIQ